jgi:AcrR family transcriptional regulator
MLYRRSSMVVILLVCIQVQQRDRSMARTVGSHGPRTMETIRRVGLRLIHKHGYEAMSLRQLASEVGIQAGSLYNHITTKQQLLFDLIKTHMDELLQESDRALKGIEDPDDQLKTFIAFHLDYHTAHKREVFISYSELRSLEPGNYGVVVALRRAYERKLIDILDCGVAKREFAVSDTTVAAFGILAMLTGVCTWFKPSGRLSKEQVIEIYSDMVLKGLAWTPAQSGGRRPQTDVVSVA